MLQHTKRRIVVAEDEDATRALLRRQLERAGYDVAAFANGREALETISGMGTGVVLADWAMPEMDGLELCRAIRELENMQALGNIYFILLTAHDSKERTIEGLAAGANDYLTKPYHQGELLARIQVGERMLRLQDELLSRTIEAHKANAQLATLTRKLEELANTDALTGLPNRRCIFQRLDEAWQLAERNGLPLSCIMLDIDRFKRINDTLGHAAGDEILRHVAWAVSQAVQRPELCGRFGGEEFLVLCPGATGAAAAELAEEIRHRVRMPATVGGGAIATPSVSCGVATRTPAMRSRDELIRSADAMLYAAKENGRDQTWLLGDDGIGHAVPATNLSAFEAAQLVTP